MVTNFLAASRLDFNTVDPKTLLVVGLGAASAFNDKLGFLDVVLHGERN
jgi:hypothetical protein